MPRTKQSESDDATLLGPVVRAFRAVRAISEATGPMSGKELSDVLDLPPSTVHRLLQLLCRVEIVARDTDGQRYVPGPELFRIGFSVTRKSDAVAKARPHVQAIVDEFNITSVLWLYMPSDLMVVSAIVIHSSHSLDFRDIAFAPRDLVWGCVGRAVLAFLPADVVTRALKRNHPSPTGIAMPARAALEEDLARIRAAGVAFSEGQTISGGVGFAAPIYGSGDEVLGCLSATMPSVRFDPAERDRYLGFIRARAERLSAELGARATAHSASQERSA